jgi:FdhE protein
VPGLDADALWQLAAGKWREITTNSPDLAPAVALQQRLLRILLDASAVLDDSICLPTPGPSVLEKWRRGVPILHNERVTIPSRSSAILSPLCMALADGGAGDSALHIADALAGGTIDGESMVRVSLARNPKAIRTSALHFGLAPDLVWLVAELGASPLADHLQRQLFSAPNADLHAGLADWDRGYCPFCGSWPAFIEARDDARRPRCSFCALEWRLVPDRCLYCGKGSADFVAAAPDAHRRHRRVDLCRSCGSYTKVLEVAAPTPFPLVAVEDLATLDLDQGAMKRGYRRPDLFDFDKIEPFKSTC